MRRFPARPFGLRAAEGHLLAEYRRGRERLSSRPRRRSSATPWPLSRLRRGSSHLALRRLQRDGAVYWDRLQAATLPAAARRLLLARPTANGRARDLIDVRKPAPNSAPARGLTTSVLR